MKRFSMLIFNLLSCVLVCNAQYFFRDSPFYPCLDVVVSNYYNYYFRFPNKVKDLIHFAENFFEAYPEADNTCKHNLIRELLPYMKKNMKHIQIEEDEGYSYTIRMGSDTLLYISSSFWPFSPCEDSLFIGGNRKEYYHFYDKFRIPRFYSSRGEAVFYPDSVYQDFKSEVSNFQKRFITFDNGFFPSKYYVYENDTIPILSMLEYNLGKSLRYYCDGQPISLRIPFYQKLESFLESLCKAYKCQRILFMMPDYNISKNISE